MHGPLIFNGSALGGVTLEGADVAGDVRLIGHFSGLGAGPAITAEGLVCRGTVAVQASINGPFRMTGANLRDLAVRNTHFNAPMELAATFERTSVSGIVTVQRSRVLGECRLMNMRCDDQVLISQSEFRNPGGVALALDGSDISRLLRVSDLTVVGELRMVGVACQSAALLEGVDIRSEVTNALTIERLRAGESLSIAYCHIRGEARVVAVEAGGQIVIDNSSWSVPPTWPTGGHVVFGHLRSRDGILVRNNSIRRRIHVFEIDAPTFELLLLKGPVDPVDVLVQGVRCETMLVGAMDTCGIMALTQCQVGTAQILSVNGPPPGRLAVDSSTFETLRMRGISVDGLIVTRTSASVLDDERDNWVLANSYEIDGLTYSSFADYEGSSAYAKDRISWLERSHNASSSAYLTLARTFSSAGATKFAHEVMIAFNRRAPLGWRQLLKPVGYGYRLHRVLYAMIALYLASVCLASWAQSRELLTQVSECSVARCFNAWAYAFDALIPLVDLGQDGAFLVAFADSATVAGFFWVVKGAGWIGLTIVLTGFASVVTVRSP